MPPEPKRKRGRRANASKQAAASQDRPDEYEADAEEDARPRKRGRPRRSLDDAPAETEVVSSQIRKRGRPSLGGGEKVNETKAADEPQTRGRPSLENQDRETLTATEGSRRTSRKKGSKAQYDEQEAEEAEPQVETGPRKRGRKPVKAVPTEAAEEAEPEPDRPVPKKKRGRPSFTAPEVQEEAPKEDRARRKGRRSLQDLPPDDAQNKSTKGAKVKKGKRPSRTGEGESETRDEGPPKKRGRPSLTNGDVAEDVPKEDERSSSRRRSANPNEPPPSPPKPYLHVVSKTRRIRPSTIATKWSPLTGPSLPTITSLLQLAHAPILQRTSHTHNRRARATVALELITKRITRKLAKGIPFPPATVAPASRALIKNSEADGGREMELDFEAVLDARTVLERQLTPGLQAVELLQRERERMEKELERDYENLRKLEARARGQARERRELLKKAHVLAPTARTSPPDEDSQTLHTASTTPSDNLFKNLSPTLTPLALQLANHIDSIQTNLSQASGVVPRIAHTRAALQDVLLRYLDIGAYENVVLGTN